MNIYVALFDIAFMGGIVGYLLGLARPIRRARNWAHRQLSYGTPGRLAQALVLLLLPELTTRVLWHRRRPGRYPEPPPRRPAPQLAARWRDKLTTDSPEEP